NPVLRSFCNRDALAFRGVSALQHFMSRSHRPGISLLFRPERLKSPVAALVDVVNNPGFALDALRCFPFALANRHCSPPSCVAHVAKLRAHASNVTNYTHLNSPKRA